MEAFYDRKQPFRNQEQFKDNSYHHFQLRLSQKFQPVQLDQKKKKNNVQEFERRITLSAGGIFYV